MKALKSFYLEKPVTFFLLITFIITWSILILYSAGKAELIEFQLPEISIALVGQFGPLFSVLILFGLFEEKQSLKKLFKRAINFKVGLFWFLFVIFLEPIVFIVSLIITMILGGDMPDFPDNSNWGMFVGNFIVGLFVGLIFGGLSEEIGWRGFMLPKLQQFTSPIIASFVIAICWTIWHLDPDYLVAAFTTGWSSFFEKSIPGFGNRFLETLPFAVIMTYVFNRTNGNILLMIIMHSASNALISGLPIVWSDTPEIFKYSAMTIYWLLAIGLYSQTKLLSSDKKKWTEV